jgi:DNA-binding beta-propeller fold protein YncE
VAVLDVKEGSVVKTIPIGNPHGIFYSTQLKRLFVVDGASGDVKVFNGEDYSLVKTIPLTRGADSMTYDPRSQSLFVGNGGEDAKMKQALVSVIDAVHMEKVADIPVNTLGLEGLAVDSAKRILYVNLDENDKGVAVVDLNKREVVDIWKLPAGPHRSKAIAFDDAHARLFVVSRDSAMRGSIIIFNVADGQPVATLPVGGWADGISIDQRRQRIYVSTGLGYMETYTIESNDVYRRLEPVETAILGKTSLYSAELDRVYVDIPHLGSGSEDAAKVMIFRPTP